MGLANTKYLVVLGILVFAQTAARPQGDQDTVDMRRVFSVSCAIGVLRAFGLPSVKLQTELSSMLAPLIITEPMPEPDPQQAISFSSAPLDDSDLSDFEFGNGYLRMYVTGVNLPHSKDAESLFLTITTGNKTSLSFKAAFEHKPGVKVSSFSEIPVVPYVALNTKTPLMVSTELRRKKRVSESVDLIGGLLNTVASVFTGGAAASLTRLGTYAKATGDIVKDYESRTESADLNGNIIFDHNFENTIKAADMSSYFYVFTGGNGFFDAYDTGGQKVRITEAMVIGAEKVNNYDEGTSGRLWKLRLRKSPSPRAGRDDKLGDRPATVEMVVYLKSDQRFLILRVESYDPFPLLARHPERIPELVPFFEVLAELTNSDLSVQSSTDANGRTTAQQPPTNAAAMNAVLAREGKLLYTQLRTMANAGDLSLTHAHQTMKRFIERAECLFANPSDFRSKKYLNSLAMLLCT